MEENSNHDDPDHKVISPINNTLLNGKAVSASNELKHRTSSTSQSLSLPKILPIYHRSLSLSIPVNCDNLQNDDNFYSKSLTANTNTNYGATHSINDIRDKPLDFYKVFDETENNPTDLEASSNAENSTEEKKKSFIRNMNSKQRSVFWTLLILSLNDTMGFSLMSTFFPVVAKDKGLSAVHIGLIFSSYSVFGVFGGLIIGTVLVRVGAKFCIISGMFLGVGSVICFGFLNLMDKIPFLVLGIVARGIMGFGSNMAYTAMFAVVFQEFGDNSITVLSLSEALVGIGGMAGVLIGSALYEAGGYITPFLVMGGTQIILLIVSFFIIPYVPVDMSDSNISPFYLLKHSSAIFASATVTLIFVVNSFVSANMANFLTRVFGMDALMAGVVFLVMSVFYAGLSPLWGYIAGRWKSSYIVELGLLGMSIGLVLIGPANLFLEVFDWPKQQLWLLYVCCVILGSCYGAAAMPTFNEMILAAEELKLKDNMLAQYGLVSGLWNVMFSVGDILGPSLGGVMVTSYGFEDSIAIFGLCNVTLVVLRLLQRYYRHRQLKKRDSSIETDETRPLLNSVNS